MRLYRSHNVSGAGEWIVASNYEEAIKITLECNKKRRAAAWRVNEVNCYLGGKYGDSLAKLLALDKAGVAFIVGGDGWKVVSGGIKYNPDGSKF